MTSDSYGESVMTSGSYGESIMTSGSYGQSVMMSGSYGPWIIGLSILLPTSILSDWLYLSQAYYYQ